MKNQNDDPRSFKEFKAAVKALSPDARLVFKRMMPRVTCETWPRGLFLLSDLVRADHEQLNPLTLPSIYPYEQRNILGLAGRLGLTASEIDEAFGNLWIKADDLLEWLLDMGRLQLLTNEDGEAW